MTTFPDDDSIAALCRRAGEVLSARGSMLVAAESCTGGWLAKAITDLPGSSGWFERGLITYSNAAKIELLGVIPATLETHGAVSEPAVIEMVAGALMHSRADVAVAVSGIAGPDGGVPEKPVGTVWLAWRRAGRDAGRARCFHYAGDREAVRRQAVADALAGVIELIRDQSG